MEKRIKIPETAQKKLIEKFQGQELAKKDFTDFCYGIQCGMGIKAKGFDVGSMEFIVEEKEEKKE